MGHGTVTRSARTQLGSVGKPVWNRADRIVIDSCTTQDLSNSI